MTATRDPFAEYQSPAIGGSAAEKGTARERPGQEINGDELAEAFRHDLHGETYCWYWHEHALSKLIISFVTAKMMTSPMRRCAVTGAKLPRGPSIPPYNMTCCPDYLTHLLPSIDFMICLRPAVYPASDSTLSDTPKDPREGNIYLVPDKILHPNHNDKLGKGSWLLCHRGLVQTFIDRPGEL
jgi:hypothetical protein